MDDVHESLTWQEYEATQARRNGARHARDSALLSVTGAAAVLFGGAPGLCWAGLVLAVWAWDFARDWQISRRWVAGLKLETEVIRRETEATCRAVERERATLAREV